MILGKPPSALAPGSAGQAKSEVTAVTRAGGELTRAEGDGGARCGYQSRMPTLLRALGTGVAGDASRSRLRAAKRRVVRPFTNRVVNPLVRRLVQRGLLGSGWALLETRGRRSGCPRVVPVGNGLRDGVFWIVTEHGYHADYVRNILQEPRVRVMVGGRWRAGRAHVLTEDDPYARLRALRRPLNDAALLAVGTEQLVVRVDFDCAEPSARR